MKFHLCSLILWRLRPHPFPPSSLCWPMQAFLCDSRINAVLLAGLLPATDEHGARCCWHLRAQPAAYIGPTNQQSCCTLGPWRSGGVFKAWKTQRFLCSLSRGAFEVRKKRRMRSRLHLYFLQKLYAWPFFSISKYFLFGQINSSENSFVIHHLFLDTDKKWDAQLIPFLQKLLHHHKICNSFSYYC